MKTGVRKRWLLATGVAFARLALGADGDPDAAFGVDGQLTIERPADTPAVDAAPGDIAALPDGRFLWVMANEDGTVWVGRAQHDGSADASFGSDGSGHVTLADCAADSPTRLIANADGGAVVWSGACLIALRADGSIRTGFGDTPLPIIGFYAGGFARDNQGRYVLAGTSNAVWFVFRFDANGAADADFGTDGMQIVDIPEQHGERQLNALAVIDDGRILLAGSRGGTDGSNLVLARLKENGAFDPKWNGTGLVDMAAPANVDGLSATAIAPDADGSVVVAGLGATITTGCCVLLARFDADGALVADFGLRLYPLDGINSTSFEQRDALALLPDHDILFATTAFPTGDASGTHRTQFILLRANRAGVLDPTFGDGGWRGYTIDDPTGTGQTGDYDELHAMAYAQGSALLFGRTFFEDQTSGRDYISVVRARFETIFASDFE